MAPQIHRKTHSPFKRFSEIGQAVQQGANTKATKWNCAKDPGEVGLGGKEGKRKIKSSTGDSGSAQAYKQFCVGVGTDNDGRIQVVHTDKVGDLSKDEYNRLYRACTAAADAEGTAKGKNCYPAWKRAGFPGLKKGRQAPAFGGEQPAAERRPPEVTPAMEGYVERYLWNDLVYQNFFDDSYEDFNRTFSGNCEEFGKDAGEFENESTEEAFLAHVSPKVRAAYTDSLGYLDSPMPPKAEIDKQVAKALDGMLRGFRRGRGVTHVPSTAPRLPSAEPAASVINRIVAKASKPEKEPEGEEPPPKEIDLDTFLPEAKELGIDLRDKADVKITVSDREKAEIQEWLQEATGKKVNAEQAVQMLVQAAGIGAVSSKGTRDKNGASFRIHRTGGKISKVIVNGAGPSILNASRIFSIKEGKLSIHNDIFKVDRDRVTGAGPAMLAQQVRNGRALADLLGVKFKGMDTMAAGHCLDATFNGYYTWPRSGYQAEISDQLGAVFQEKIGETPKTLHEIMLSKKSFPLTRGMRLHIKSKIEEAGDLLKTVSSYDKKEVKRLYQTVKKEGERVLNQGTISLKDGWRFLGAWINCEFDASPNSPHLKVLLGYLAEKQGKTKKEWVDLEVLRTLLYEENAKAKAPQKNKGGDDWGNYTAEDDAIFDRVWASLGE